MNREQAINYLISSGFTHEQVGEVVRALTYEPARLSVDEVTALAEWTEKLTKASEDAYNKGYADGMKAQAEHEGLCKEEREISKEKAIEILRADSIASYSVEDILSARDMAIKALEQEQQTFKWCTDCKEYDQEKHCCHRWSKVIRNTVEEMKQEYIEREVLDKIDEIITDALDKSTDQKESQTLRWVLDKISEVT